jgi:hypothetical protein
MVVAEIRLRVGEIELAIVRPSARALSIAFNPGNACGQDDKK